ncbi:LysR family transcriptional regulator [Acidiphilium cryptum]|uniref:Transcriptional regulator, LysR family n=1 Tax=Acidiphilium cryptum (strain JF-5) TaxID=349163 RepID=A5FTV2_ACICJ|nr:LysR family transcriptional regulator [Acidiphilium cryptum]ABQ29034.1 transcriptional regulator, LysR family [Acidiphilium cryptum JF-5]
MNDYPNYWNNRVPSLSDYETFVAIVEAGSLTAASRRMNRSLQSVSRALANIERDTGANLVRRTTRSMQPTDAGLVFYGRIKEALSDIAAAHTEAAELTREIAGTLRIGSSTLFGPTYVVPTIAAFMRRHPAVAIQLVLEDSFQDLLKAELDLAIRIGELSDSRAMATRVGALRRVAFAAPEYLLKHGRPKVPGDLRAHCCVIRTLTKSPQRWTFESAGKPETIPVAACFSSDNAGACNEAVAEAVGIGIAPLWQIAGMLETGRVELILTEYEPPPTPVHVVWPQASLLPTRTRAFIDFLAARLRSGLRALR